MHVSEGALAEVVEGMSIVSRAEKRLNHLEARLQQCRVFIDPDSFKNLRYHLDKLHAELSPIPLQVAEAKAKRS